MKQPAQKQIHVASNPFFAFHDDVFPAFAKNAVAQPLFPPNLYSTTIIPDEFFTSLAGLKHISTVKIKLDGKDRFQLDIDFPVETAVLKETKVLEFVFFDGKSLFSFGYFKNASLWINSDFHDEKLRLRSNLFELREMTFILKSSRSKKTFNLKVSEEQLNLRERLPFELR